MMIMVVQLFTGLSELFLLQQSSLRGLGTVQRLFAVLLNPLTPFALPLRNAFQHINKLCTFSYILQY